MKKEANHLYKIVKPIYVVLLKLLYRPQFLGTENIPEDGAIIFAGNHVHAFDPIMVMTSTKRIVHYMAKEDLFKGVHGWIFRKIGLIPVHRSKSNPLAVMEAERILENGGAVGIFPEGTRNRTEAELLPFRKGTVLIAQKTGSKVIPFAIKGEYKLFKKSITIEYGKPIELSNLDKIEANEELKNEVLKLIRK